MAKERLKIAVDCDDVLAKNALGFTTFSNERWGTSLTADDYTENWSELWRVDHTEAERRCRAFFEESIVRSFERVDGAYEVLQRLVKRHQLVVATARRLQIKNDTLDWIDQYFPDIFARDAVHFAGIWDEITESSHLETKADLIARIEADVLVDDQLKHCLAVAETGRRAILFGDYRWNKVERLPDSIVRCDNWCDVEEEIERITSS